MPTLHVFWESELVGRLARAGRWDVTFQYAESYLAADHARPISLSLPLQTEPFRGDLPRAWFANLLPEGEVRGQVARQLGVSERNEFAILEGIAGDCAGALRLLPGATCPERDSALLPLPWDKLESAIAASPRPSLLTLVLQEGELRLSLAGAQDKLPVHYAEGALSLPSGGAASTHLLKIAGGGFPGLVENELYCLRLARAVGLPVPVAEMAATATPILLIERFDRCRNADGSVSRLHQEDFCQALGLPPESKYESEGGPSLAQLFAVLARGSVAPLPDKRHLLRWLLFNFIIGNADAHAKNVSFLIGGRGQTTGPRLAPFYDLVCTEVYGAVSRRQAQKIGGEYRPDRIAARHWDRLAESIGVQRKYLRAVGLELSEQIDGIAGPLAEEIGAGGVASRMLTEVTAVIGKRIQLLRATLRD